MGSGTIFGVNVCDFRNDLFTFADNVSVLRYFKFDLVNCEFSVCWNDGFDFDGRFNWCIWWYEPVEKSEKKKLKKTICCFSFTWPRHRIQFTFILCWHFGVSMLIVHQFSDRILLKFATWWTHAISIGWTVTAATVCTLATVWAACHSATFDAAWRHWLRT